MHTRIRNSYSALQNDLFRANLIPSPWPPCIQILDTALILFTVKIHL